MNDDILGLIKIFKVTIFTMRNLKLEQPLGILLGRSSFPKTTMVDPVVPMALTSKFW